MKDIDSILLNEAEGIKKEFHQHSFFMGSALVFLNIFLMSCVGIYWTNTAVHQYISGRPL